MSDHNRDLHTDRDRARLVDGANDGSLLAAFLLELRHRLDSTPAPEPNEALAEYLRPGIDAEPGGADRVTTAGAGLAETITGSAEPSSLSGARLVLVAGSIVVAATVGLGLVVGRTIAGGGGQPVAAVAAGQRATSAAGDAWAAPEPSSAVSPSVGADDADAEVGAETDANADADADAVVEAEDEPDNDDVVGIDVLGAGWVELAIVDGELRVVSATAVDRWRLEERTGDDDKVELSFRRGRDVAEVKVEINGDDADGHLKIEMDGRIQTPDGDRPSPGGEHGPGRTDERGDDDEDRRSQDDDNDDDDDDDGSDDS